MSVEYDPARLPFLLAQQGMIAVILYLAFNVGALAQTLPKASGYVTDRAQVIDEVSRRQIEELCQELESKTGSQLAVVTLRSLNGEPIEDYAVKLFEEWGIGQKGKDNGVLVLVAIHDRRSRIEVGYGLEAVITDGYTGEVLRSLRSYFRANQYGPGLYVAANQLAIKIAQSAGVTLSAEPVSRKPLQTPQKPLGLDGLATGALILLALVLLPYLFNRGGNGFVSTPRHGYRGRRYLGGGFGGFGGGFSGSGSGGFGGFGGGISGGGGGSSDW